MKKMIVVLIISLLFVWGCSDNNSQSVDTKVDREITVTASNWKFEPSTINVKKGETIKLVVKSTTGTHGLAVSELNIKTKSIKPSKEETIIFKAEKTGTFPFYCNVYCGSGHKNMKGSIVIK